MEIIPFTPGDMSRILASLMFAEEQHKALAALSTGDERTMHLSLANGARSALDLLRECQKKFTGTFSLSWSEDVRRPI